VGAGLAAAGLLVLGWSAVLRRRELRAAAAAPASAPEPVGATP
jgi:hypothetical protein